MENDQKYSETFTIRASEVSPEGRVTLPALGYLLQEVAGNNALALNFGISQLNEQNRTWILHRLHLQMDSFPEWRETITIETWPSGGDKLRAYRDFRILDSKDNEIGRCLSYWLMLDLESHRPVRIPKEIIEMQSGTPSHVLDLKHDRLKVGTNSFDQSKKFHARQSDLDMNEHVNNVKYVEWALEALPDQYVIKEIDIEFQAECHAGDTITSAFTDHTQDNYLHLLQNEADKQTVAVAVSR